jgi:hypothetical protein
MFRLALTLPLRRIVLPSLNTTVGKAVLPNKKVLNIPRFQSKFSQISYSKCIFPVLLFI